MTIRRVLSDDGEVWFARGWEDILVHPVPPIDPGREALQFGTYDPDGTTTGIIPGSVLTSGGTIGGATNDASVNRVTLTDGELIENKIIYGDLLPPVVHTQDIIIRNCLLVGGADTPTGQSGVVNATISRTGTGRIKLYDCEINPRQPAAGRDGIRGYRWEAYRCNVHRVVDAFGIFTKASQGPNAGVKVKGCWAHNLSWFAPDDINARASTHNDLIQHQGGRNVHVQGNRLDGTAFAAGGTFAADTSIAQGYCGQGILLQDNTGTGFDNTVVYEQNLVSGCTQQTLFKGGVTAVYRNNRHRRAVAITSGSSGYWIRFAVRATTTITGIGTNVWEDGPYVGTFLTEPRLRGIDYIA